MGCSVSSSYKDPVPLTKAKKQDYGANLHLKNQDFGSSTEENFHDSLPWLESDCEDDFYSVNGEFTPSRGSTPNYQIITPSMPQLNRPFSTENSTVSKPEPSPTGRGKLAILFKETPHSNHDTSELNSSKESINIPEFGRESSSKIISKEGQKSSKQKADVAILNCCLPSFA